MYYDALKTFIAVVEEKNFTKAAEKLLISQPSVSLHIKNLEKEFQTTLLIRTPKHLNLTPTGEILYNRAKQMVHLYEQSKKEIYEHHHYIKGDLKIGASFTIGEYILPGILAELHAEYPDLNLEIIIGNTEEIVKHVRLFQVDIGLIEGQTNEKELTIQPFMEDELCIIAPPDHPLAERGEIEIEELQKQEWISREKGSGTREYLEHLLSSNGLQVKSLLTISSNQGVKESVMNGLGLSILSRVVAGRDVQQNNLSILQIKHHEFRRKFSYLYSPIISHKKNRDIFIEALIKKK
ncbi:MULTISPECIES: selenium metabolism-associated LysR family transcriptional regulator [Bacillaceae]|uniref:selenium metabolism-associated LysR family transcriptional regulator n=1 Tax=Bacillaceae TaxID=186817 RepID=UPI000C777CB4|nr:MULTISPECIES: selenium metabolism-associated LysR family transcriptional regulator [Bacillaceae]PLR67229.1 LysR family transcriptional regulator [Bacillus sp. UMB0893]QNG60449.1 LysR family transcriptional regulator [Bacillus sp. PAMC26568]